MNKRIKGIGQRIRSRADRLRKFINKNLGETWPGAAAAAHLAAGTMIGAVLCSCFPFLPMVLCTLCGVVLSVLVFGVIFLCLMLVTREARKSAVYWFGTWISLFMAAYVAAQGENSAGNLLFAVCFTVGLDLLARCLWAFLVKRRHSGFVAVCGVAAALLLGGAGYVLAVEGFSNEELEQIYTAGSEARAGLIGQVQSGTPDKNVDAGEQSGTQGGSVDTGTQSGAVHRVETAEYGLDAAMGLATDTVDLSFFMERDAVQGIGMEYFFGYDLTEVPLAGKVWYPAEEGCYPALFIIHGNHSYTTPSYLGYDYLGKYLAARGYLVVSVDESCCNDLTQENDARAILLLENMKALRELTGDETSPLFGKIDWERTALAGHSRGGEAVATACLFNGCDSYPENGNVSFDYDFSIQSVIAIAPTVDQYMPVDHAVVLEDVNYLLLAGAYDQDVTTFMGMKQYENIRFSGKGDYIKSALFIGNANHGQFNELWGKYDLWFPLNRFLNTAVLLEEEQQQAIAQLFIGTFLDVTLKNDRTGEKLLRNYAAYGGKLPETVFEQCFQTSDFVCAADFDEDSRLESATMEGAVLDVTGLVKWTEEKTAWGDGGTQENYAGHFKWEDSDCAEMILKLPGYDLRGQSLQFDIADRDTERIANGDNMPLDGKILIEDAAGESATVQISSYALVYPPLPVQLYKVDALTDGQEWKFQMQTVSVPAEDFTEQNPAVNLEQVRSVSLVFEGTGEIYLDNVGFEAEKGR